MIAILQVLFLLGSAWILMSFKRKGCRYRPVISFIASCWAGTCMAAIMGMLVEWPDASVNFTTTILSALSLAAAIASRGNVALVLRWLRLDK